MKRKITKAEYDALDPKMQGFYKVDGDNNYVLQIEGDEDTGALKRAKEREAQRAKDEKERADKLQEQLDSMSDGNARRTGDIATLEKSWQAKVDTEKAKTVNITSAKDKVIRKLTVDREAERIATKLCGDQNAHLMIPHIRERFDVDFSGEEPKLIIMDTDGKPSAMNLEDLEKEIVDNKKFSAIIIGSKASGGAGGSRDSGNGGRSGAGSHAGKKFEEMNDAERTALYKENPAEFRRLSAEAQQRRRGY